MGTVNEYKGKNICEKSWIIYNALCDLGKKISDLKNSSQETKRQTASSFWKYFPGSEDIRELLDDNLTSSETFVTMYCDYLNVELDEELIWPYHWHLNL